MSPGQVGGTKGRRKVAPGLIVLLMVVAGAILAVSRFGPRSESRPPLLRHPAGPGRPAELMIDSAVPGEPVELLFFQGRPAVPGQHGRRVVVSDAGTVLESDSAHGMRPVAASLSGSAVLDAAPARDGGWWFSTLDGELIRTDIRGVPTFRAPAPFGATALWPLAGTDGVIATRSPERYGFLPESPDNPVIAVLDREGHPGQGRGRILVPEHSLLATLANAGYGVAAGDTVYFAPLSRPELVAFGPQGDTLWVSRAEDVPPTPEPRIKIVAGRVHIDFQPLNLALTLGPDGRLYLIRAVDTALRLARLDVLDRRSGNLLWSAALAAPRATLGASRNGRVYALDADRLLGAIPPNAREPLPDFTLPRLGGGSTALADHLGKVILVNVWASWCAPCRTEMPALDTLQRGFLGDGFAFLAMSEDQDRSDAERFVRERHFDFPVLFGDGRLKSRYHYPGLPMTMLVDRRGRIVRRWFGELQPSDLTLIRTLVRSELLGQAAAAGTGPAETHQHHRSP